MSIGLETALPRFEPLSAMPKLVALRVRVEGHWRSIRGDY